MDQFQGSRSVYVTGTARGLLDDDIATIAYDAQTGLQLWATTTSDGSQAAEIELGPLGRGVYVTGTTDGGIGNGDYATIAYDAAAGTQLWFSAYGGPVIDQAWAIAVAPDESSVFVTGMYLAGEPTVAYDAATGGQLWTAGPPDSTYWDIAVAPDGATVYESGGRMQNGQLVLDLLAHAAANGALLWERMCARPGKVATNALALALVPDGSALFATGYEVQDQQQGSDILTVSYST